MVAVRMCRVASCPVSNFGFVQNATHLFTTTLLLTAGVNVQVVKILMQTIHDSLTRATVLVSLSMYSEQCLLVIRCLL